MKKVVRTFLSLSFLLQASTLRGQDRAIANQVEIGQSVPFELTAGFLISVKGRIGQFDGLQFILDTGATTSVVDRKIAKKLPISLHRDRVFAFQRYVDLEQAEFPEIQFGPVKAQNVSLQVADLVKVSEIARHADAIIGMDLLSMSKTVGIDYNTSTVSFLAFGSGEGDVLSRRPQCLAAQLMVQGHPVQLLIDTGIEQILLFENRLRERVPGLRLEGKPKTTHVGWIEAKATTLPGVQWRNSESAMNVLLAEGPAKSVLPGIDGYLGTASLKARQIEFDFEKNVVTLRWQ